MLNANLIHLTDKPAKKIAATMGNFDGFHHGHRLLVDGLINSAQQKNLAPWLITFDPHPKYYFDKNLKNYLLTTHQEKIDLIKQTNLSGIATIAFDANLANLSPEDFTRQLLQTLPIEYLVIGDDFRFGKNRAGDGAVLQQYIAEVVRLKLFQHDREAISSSAIRQYIRDGQVAKAHQLLSRQYNITATITKGDGIGQKINSPTINLSLAEVMGDSKILPAFGIYAGLVTIAGDHTRHPAACYIGNRPSIAQKNPEPRLEAYLLHFNKNIYGKKATIHFCHWVREDKKFANLQDLEKQIALDNQQIIALLDKAPLA